MLTDYLQAAFLGVVEGLTEFIPVSSTGHLILLVDLLGFEGPPGKVFEIAIQLGAILAICVVYWPRLWGTLAGLGRDDRANGRSELPRQRADGETQPANQQQAEPEGDDIGKDNA